MARLFDASASQYLGIASAPITAYPLTMACWFNVKDITNSHTVVSVGNSAAGDRFDIEIQGHVGGDPVAFSISGGGLEDARTTTSYKANIWHHACAIGVNSTNRSIFLDGGGEDNVNDDLTPTSLNNIKISERADYSGGHHVDGRVAEVGIWNAALTDAEVKLLAMGLSPLLVRRQNLVFYAPLTYRSQDFDIVGRLNMTAYNSPSWAEHPSGLTYPYPRPPMIAPDVWAWTEPIPAEGEETPTFFPFSDTFTGNPGDPWSSTLWTTSVG